MRGYFIVKTVLPTSVSKKIVQIAESPKKMRPPPERKSKIPKTHYIAIKILSPVREARWEVANLTKQKNPPVYGVKEIVRLYVCLWSNLLFIMEGWRGITV